MRPKRDAVSGAEWHIHAVLMHDGKELENSPTRLRISDSRLTNEFGDSTRAIGLWLDDLAQKRVREQRAAKARKKR